ncbi:MAG TPA: tetratricopeptide repeat protein [Longimicrobiaceae bacterium]|jgi:tetratricopeptide (TPR) repeat protein
MKPREGGAGPRIPPLPPGLLLRGGDAAWEAVLRELPDPAALPAWETLRYVRLWLAAEPARRAGLFRGGSQARRELELIHQTLDPDLSGPLAVLSALLADGRAEPGEAVWACLCVADWALLRGARETGGLFAETAALAAPEKPGLAFMVGRMARSRGDAFAAERWLKRAAAVAWRVGEWEVYARSVNSLGNLRLAQGAYPDALRLNNKALRAVRRNRIGELEGEVLHDLFIVSFLTNDFKRAEAFCHAASAFYTGGHPRLPQFAHDVAYFWIEQGYFARALTVVQQLLSHFHVPHERLKVLASTARAAAACGRRQLFERLWIEANSLIPELDDTSTLAAALVELAIGASSLGDWEHAAAAATQAHGAAQERGEADVQFRADAVLSSVRRHRKAEVESRSGGRFTNPGDDLASSIVRSLQSVGAESC